ncbi:NOX5 oxidase, partial [Hippolais icterina]|nr:NOX5 oxidase [Hippolais icterina]
PDFLLPVFPQVTHLVIQRPKSFRFQPGDYVYLNVPAIAAYEWHPFSISSAPEQTGSTPDGSAPARDPCLIPGIRVPSLGSVFNPWDPCSILGIRVRSPGSAGSVASGRDGAVELTAFRASGAAFPGKDPEQG